MCISGMTETHHIHDDITFLLQSIWRFWIKLYKSRLHHMHSDSPANARDLSQKLWCGVYSLGDITTGEYLWKCLYHLLIPSKGQTKIAPSRTCCKSRTFTETENQHRWYEAEIKKVAEIRFNIEQYICSKWDGTGTSSFGGLYTFLLDTFWEV